MNQFFVSLGSNLGDRAANLAVAKKSLENMVGPVLSASAVYETEPWGYSGQDAFFNQVILAESALGAAAVLEFLLEIEKKMGRKRDIKWGPRLIDLDILLFNDEIICTPGLSIPHPEMHNRRFVLQPLAEIAPEKRHPVLQKTVADLLKELTDALHVHKR